MAPGEGAQSVPPGGLAGDRGAPRWGGAWGTGWAVPQLLGIPQGQRLRGAPRSLLARGRLPPSHRGLPGSGGGLAPCWESVYVCAGGGEDFLEFAAAGGIFLVGAGWGPGWGKLLGPLESRFPWLGQGQTGGVSHPRSWSRGSLFEWEIPESSGRPWVIGSSINSLDWGRFNRGRGC